MDAAIKPRAMADDSDEEDLEALRLAALQSIKSKPTVVAPRRRPKPMGRPNRNFFRGCVNTNLISIVPSEIPLEKNEAVKIKADDPPPLVLPQHRYCKTEVKSEPAEKETQVSTKFSRFEDSNSGDSDDDYDDEFEEKSNDSDTPHETARKAANVEADEPDADDDELLLQDEDSLGKFFNEMEEELEEKKREKSPSTNVTSHPSDLKKPSGKVDSVPVVNNNSDCGVKVVSLDVSSFKGNVDNKSDIREKRVLNSSESVTTKDEPFSSKNHLHDSSPRKKALVDSEEDDKRINQPCISGRNRSPSPAGGKFQSRAGNSPSSSRKRNDSPLKRRPSPPSPASLSPLYKKDAHLSRTTQGKAAHPPRSLPSRNSPQDVTPPSYWGSRSNSNYGHPNALTSREWSSSPHKWSGHQVPGSFSDPPRHSGAKTVSPLHLSRSSKSPPRRGSRVRRSSDRDWSTSPPRRKCRDFGTPPDLLNFSSNGRKVSKRKSLSPARLGNRSRQGNRGAGGPFSNRFSPTRKSSNRSCSRSPRRSPAKKISHRSRSRSPRYSPPRMSSRHSRSRSPRYSPAKKSSCSPVKVRRSRSPVRSLSRTPSLSPSPDRGGKSSAGNYRRHKSPLRLPGYRPPRIQDVRPFRPDGKANRKDSERRAMRVNVPTRKPVDSKLEISKVRPLISKTESKSREPTPEEKVDSSAQDVVRAGSPVSVPLPCSWSSDEDGESDSESRFKGTEAKGVQPVGTPPKPVLSARLKVRDLEGSASPGKKSPKKKKSKRSKKILSKSKGNSPDESQTKKLNDVDLRAELSRRRAERVIKSKSTNPSVPVRLVQSAFQSLTSKPNCADGERSTLKSFTTKNDAGTELMVSKKKPIHMRLGLPVARNPDPPELPSLADSLLPRISGIEKTEGGDPNAEGGNKWRKVKLKRSVTVEKSQSRGTPNNTSGKEQVMSVSQLMLLILAGLSPWCHSGHRYIGPTSPSPLPNLSSHLAEILLRVTSSLYLGQEKSNRKNAGDRISCYLWRNILSFVNFVFLSSEKILFSFSWNFGGTSIFNAFL